MYVLCLCAYGHICMLYYSGGLVIIGARPDQVKLGEIDRRQINSWDAVDKCFFYLSLLSSPSLPPSFPYYFFSLNIFVFTCDVICMYCFTCMHIFKGPVGEVFRGSGRSFVF